MMIDVKIPIQQVLSLATKNKTVKELLQRQAINELSEQDCDMSELDLDGPHFIARDAYIVVQFFGKNTERTP